VVQRSIDKKAIGQGMAWLEGYLVPGALLS